MPQRPPPPRRAPRPRDLDAVPIAIDDLLGESVEHDAAQTSLHTRVHQCVNRIPFGRVSTYGKIAALLGRCGPRQVGYALAALPSGTDVPWHRVINAHGRLSERSGGGGTETQRIRLQAEGIVLDAKGRIDLHRYGWPETSPRPLDDSVKATAPGSPRHGD